MTAVLDTHPAHAHIGTMTDCIAQHDQVAYRRDFARGALASGWWPAPCRCCENGVADLHHIEAAQAADIAEALMLGLDPFEAGRAAGGRRLP